MECFDPIALQECEEKLHHKLHVLHETKTKCSPVDLKANGKYHKAYVRLKEEIATLWIEVTGSLQTGVTISPSSADQVQACWEKHKNGIKQALYSEYSLEKALTLYESFKMDILTQCNALIQYKLTAQELAEVSQ